LKRHDSSSAHGRAVESQIAIVLFSSLARLVPCLEGATPNRCSQHHPGGTRKSLEASESF
jgi:hypothetical protein